MNTHKPYEVGFYGGKFLPPHKGHGFSCIKTMADLCEEGHVILFYGGAQEQEYRQKGQLRGSWADLDFRLEAIQSFLDRNGYDHVELHVIDITSQVHDGQDDWDAETGLVRAIIPRIDAVFSGGPQHHDYFTRAYPEAVHVQVDPERKVYPISSTMIRADVLGMSGWMLKP